MPWSLDGGDGSALILMEELCKEMNGLLVMSMKPATIRYGMRDSMTSRAIQAMCDPMMIHAVEDHTPENKFAAERVIKMADWAMAMDNWTPIPWYSTQGDEIGIKPYHIYSLPLLSFPEFRHKVRFWEVALFFSNPKNRNIQFYEAFSGLQTDLLFAAEQGCLDILFGTVEKRRQTRSKYEWCREMKMRMPNLYAVVAKMMGTWILPHEDQTPIDELYYNTVGFPVCVEVLLYNAGTACGYPVPLPIGCRRWAMKMVYKPTQNEFSFVDFGLKGDDSYRTDADNVLFPLSDPQSMHMIETAHRFPERGDIPMFCFQRSPRSNQMFVFVEALFRIYFGAKHRNTFMKMGRATIKTAVHTFWDRFHTIMRHPPQLILPSHPTCLELLRDLADLPHDTAIYDRHVAELMAELLQKVNRKTMEVISHCCEVFKGVKKILYFYAATIKTMNLDANMDTLVLCIEKSVPLWYDMERDVEIKCCYRPVDTACTRLLAHLVSLASRFSVDNGLFDTRVITPHECRVIDSDKRYPVTVPSSLFIWYNPECGTRYRFDPADQYKCLYAADTLRRCLSLDPDDESMYRIDAGHAAYILRALNGRDKPSFCNALFSKYMVPVPPSPFESRSERNIPVHILADSTDFSFILGHPSTVGVLPDGLSTVPVDHEDYSSALNPLLRWKPPNGYYSETIARDSPKKSRQFPPLWYGDCNLGSMMRDISDFPNYVRRRDSVGHE